MAIATHTVTGTLLVPGTEDVGLQATVTFLPMTVNNALKFPDDNVSTFGPVMADTDEEGLLTAQIPESPDGVLWRVRVEPVVEYKGLQKSWTQGVFEIHDDTDFEELVDVSPTAVNETLFQDVSALAQETADHAAEVAGVVATTDGLMTAVATNPGSAFVAAQTASIAQLTAWAKSPDNLVVGAASYSAGLLTSAAVVWPDGATGTLTITSRQGGTDAVTGYTITRVVSGQPIRTYTQPTITRDTAGNATTVPQITVA